MTPDLRRRDLVMIDDHDGDAVPNTDDELPLQKSKKHKSSEEPSLKKMKRLKKKVAPTIHQASDGGTKQIPKSPQVVKDAVHENIFSPTPVTASTKPKSHKKIKKTTTGSLDIGTDGYVVHVCKPIIQSSPALILTQSTNITTSLPNAHDPESITEDSTHPGTVHTPAASASADINQHNEVTDFHGNDHPVVTALDGVADGSVILLGYTQLPDSAHLSNPDDPTADKSNEIANGLPHGDKHSVGNATNCLLDLTTSEVANLFDMKASHHEDVEYPSPMIDVDVNGYRVRQDLAETAKFIMTKYGDFVADTSHTLSFRSHMLEDISEAYHKLERSTLAKLPLPELEAICKDVSAVAQLNFNVSWLVKRLEEIRYAKELLQQFSCHKDESSVSQRVISEIEKELELQRAIVRRTQKKVEDFEERLKSEKEKIEAHEREILEGKMILQKFHERTSLVDDM